MVCVWENLARIVWKNKQIKDIYHPRESGDPVAALTAFDDPSGFPPSRE
jgi:hypothetical protein